MELTCKDCGHKYLVHSGHYHRYRIRVGRCPIKACGGIGVPDESGRRVLASRNRDVNRIRHGLDENI